VLGPLVGLVLVALVAAANLRMGVLGGWTDIVARATGRAAGVGWKAWFVIGIALGGFLFLVLAGSAHTHHGLGFLRSLGSDPLTAAALVGAGALIGFGAKTAGGCTSGNGLSGASFGSPGGLVAMAVFMATAVGASFVLEALT
jgi:uncharacterized membrane protein YedE/YeeE